MDKSLRVAKFNIIDMRKRIIYFYLIISIVLMFFINIGQYGEILLPVIMDVLTFIFLLSCASDTLKNKFKFAQANNISRSTFIKGTIISIFPISALMAVIDFAINRTMNLFIKAPTFYDLYFKTFEKFTDVEGRIIWMQDGGLNAIIGSVLFSFMIYSLASVIGLIIGVINLKTSERTQLIWSVLSVGLWIVWFNIDDRFLILDKIRPSTDNRVFLVLLIYILVFGVCIFGSFKMIRKATVK